MPDCNEDDADKPEEEKDTISFGIKIHDPFPASEDGKDGVRLSRKDFCIINIEPDNSKEEE